VFARIRERRRLKASLLAQSARLRTITDRELAEIEAAARDYRAEFTDQPWFPSTCEQCGRGMRLVQRWVATRGSKKIWRWVWECPRCSSTKPYRKVDPSVLDA
jgi:hypothetical protein